VSSEMVTRIIAPAMIAPTMWAMATVCVILPPFLIATDRFARAACRVAVGVQQRRDTHARLVWTGAIERHDLFSGLRNQQTRPVPLQARQTLGAKIFARRRDGASVIDRCDEWRQRRIDDGRPNSVVSVDPNQNVRHPRSPFSVDYQFLVAGHRVGDGARGYEACAFPITSSFP